MLNTQQITRSATIKVSGTINESAFHSGTLTVLVELLTFSDSDNVLQVKALGELLVENFVGTIDESGFKTCHAKLTPDNSVNFNGIAKLLECDLGLYEFDLHVNSSRLTQSAMFKTTDKIKGIDIEALFGLTKCLKQP